MKIAMLGAGAWGTALAIAFAGNNEVTLWSREQDVADDLLKTRENHRFFPGYKLPAAVRVETDFAAALAGAELLVVSTPIAGLRPTAERLKALGCTLPLLWVCKGFEAGSGKLPCPAPVLPRKSPPPSRLLSRLPPTTTPSPSRRRAICIRGACASMPTTT